jgi:hypothetical protein
MQQSHSFSRDAYGNDFAAEDVAPCWLKFELVSTLDAKELHPVADEIHNGNLCDLAVLTTMTIRKGRRCRLVTHIYIGYYTAALVA